MKQLYRIGFLIPLFLTVAGLQAQTWPADTIVVDPNSGNPRWPFPQFLEYQTGTSLALVNPKGVPHAEMEKTILDGYKIQMNRALYVPGQTLTYSSGPLVGQTLRYIRYNYGVPGDDNKLVSEGHGYALLAAALMGDKRTFDGLWCWVNDNTMSGPGHRTYRGCNPLRDDYIHGDFVCGWQTTATNPATTSNGQCSPCDAATDGDVDIGLALLIAYRQWGEFMGVSSDCGNPISYREEALKFLTSMTDTLRKWDPGANGGAGGFKVNMLTGDIGFDGYAKDGNTWGELTTWALPFYDTECPGDGGNTFSNCGGAGFFDYHASGYYHAFADFFQEQSPLGWVWNFNQYRRAEHSTDWLLGRVAANGHIPIAGSVTVNNDGTNVSYGGGKNGSAGEDFRLPLRNLLNLLWHGAPDSTWNPVTHQPLPGGNTFLYDNAVNLNAFLEDPTAWGSSCSQLGTDGASPQFRTLPLISLDHSWTGAPRLGGVYRGTNWIPGASSPAPVIAADVSTAAKAYRQLEIEWDTHWQVADVIADPNRRYLGSGPKYFHGWFRLAGLLTLTGNWHSPTTMRDPQANVKVYQDVSSTVAFTGDTITYTLSYRNYSSVNALDVILRDTLPAPFRFVSATGGGVYNAGSHSVTWNLGTIPGRTSTNLAATQGQVEIKAVVEATSGRYCQSATIETSNGTGWRTNEYPNVVSSTYKINCIDVLSRALILDKSAHREIVNPDDSIAYTISIKNTSDAGWLNGGRPNVVVTHANRIFSSAIYYMYFRIQHAADEPYINYGNYRISYYMNSVGTQELLSASAPGGWDLQFPVYEGGAISDIDYQIQKIPFGSDAAGSWNQRLIVKFADQIAAPASHLYQQTGNDHRIHRGTNFPLRAWFSLKNGFTTTENWASHWSYASNWQTQSAEGSIFHPISPGWTDPSNPTGYLVNKYNMEDCQTQPQQVTRVLVEEFDGHVWRRAFGNGPVPGRELANVVIRDTLPDEVVWGGWIKQTAFGETASYDPGSRVVTITIPQLLVGDSSGIAYYVFAKSEAALGGCPLSDTYAVNRAWGQADAESPYFVEDTVEITCDELPPPPPLANSMWKTADQPSYAVGDSITYTIAYKQTQGSIANPSTTAAGYFTTWRLHNNVAPAQTPNFTNLGNSPYPNGGRPWLMTHDYSHGQNGEVRVQIDHDNWTDFALVFRYQSGHPALTNFQGVMLHAKPGVSGNQIFLQAYNNQTAVPTSITTSFPAPLDPFTLIVRLNGNTMQVWVNDATGPPLYTTSAISVLTPGYVGLYNGHPSGSGTQNGNHSLLSWRTEFDSAFDVELWDQVPGQVTFGRFLPQTVPAPKTYNPTTNADTLFWSPWPATSGGRPYPILYGDSTGFSWRGAQAACALTVNTAYAAIHGFPDDSIGAQVVTTCDIVTPVTWAGFQIIESPTRHAKLTLLTAQELNNSYFLVERSEDLQSWVALAQIPGQGTTSQPTTYTYTDGPLSEGDYYYRITQFDFDGSSESTPVRLLSLSGSLQVNLFPNPSEGAATLQVKGAGLYYDVKVMDLTGRLVETHHQVNTGLPLQLGATLAEGSYVVSVDTQEERRVLRWVRRR